MPATTRDVEFMNMAIAEARRSVHKDDRVHPEVGAVVVSGDELLARGCHGDLNAPCDHAEFTVLEKMLKDQAVAGCTVYPTLEPCTTRHYPKHPCAKHLIEHRVSRVVIGMLDPNRAITGKGILELRNAGISVELFPPDLMGQIEELNRRFIREQQTAPDSIVVGTTIKNTPYDFDALFDDSTQECVVVAQNLRTLISKGVLQHFKLMLARGAHVAIVLTTYDAAVAIGEPTRAHYVETIRELTRFVRDIPPESRNRLGIHFHPGATSLSAMVRTDKNHEKMVFTPKFATDTDPSSRVFCVVDRRENRDIYDRLTGHLAFMMEPSPLTLETVAKRVDTEGGQRTN